MNRPTARSSRHRQEQKAGRRGTRAQRDAARTGAGYGKRVAADWALLGTRVAALGPGMYGLAVLFGQISDQLRGEVRPAMRQLIEDRGDWAVEATRRGAVIDELTPEPRG